MTIDPRHAFWRKRVEGQIRHTMNEYSEWFNLPDEATKDRCIRSTAKRIIGEIVAGTPTGDDSEDLCKVALQSPDKDSVQAASAESGEADGTRTVGLTSILQQLKRWKEINSRGSLYDAEYGPTVSMEYCKEVGAIFTALEQVVGLCLEMREALEVISAKRKNYGGVPCKNEAADIADVILTKANALMGDGDE